MLFLGVKTEIASSEPTKETKPLQDKYMAAYAWNRRFLFPQGLDSGLAHLGVNFSTYNSTVFLAFSGPSPGNAKSDSKRFCSMNSGRSSPGLRSHWSSTASTHVAVWL